MTLVESSPNTSPVKPADPSAQPKTQKFVLTLSCVERAGIVQALTTSLGASGT